MRKCSEQTMGAVSGLRDIMPDSKRTGKDHDLKQQQCGRKLEGKGGSRTGQTTDIHTTAYNDQNWVKGIVPTVFSRLWQRV
ncbi:hypothetical protein [Chitinophaga pinensis]|uniref:Uncharacterized protein n=1 Tax=Chitinophaga pinensis TaxID=79329 RepID=A0A5C6LQQ7_9BACT|nr:hypothetical protein [Chitinophaga pinensis]TWV95096.1 hypothetical protein FEF09_25210 [Chitinophaga pinensis]